jgi:hypothetical protein
MMFAAPKSSSNVVSVLLEQLAARFGGEAFWIYLDGARVYCFDSAGAAGDGATLERGTVTRLEDLRFGAALRAAEEQFTLDSDGRNRLSALPLTTRRGHYFGHLGLTVPAAAQHPPREEMVRMVQAAMTDL